MKFGVRIPSLTKRIAARTSPARALRHRAGLKAPRGMGWLTDPKRAVYNRIYSRTTVDATSRGAITIVLIVAAIIAFVVFH